jgi:hypothetical protein
MIELLKDLWEKLFETNLDKKARTLTKTFNDTVTGLEKVADQAAKRAVNKAAQAESVRVKTEVKLAGLEGKKLRAIEKAETKAAKATQKAENARDRIKTKKDAQAQELQDVAAQNAKIAAKIKDLIS